MPELVIDRVNIIDYRMPLKRPYGTARGVTRSSKNFLIRLFANQEGTPVVGVGEAQPRHRLTGDVSVDLAWDFLREAAEKLRDRSLGLNSPAEALDSVRAVMADLADLAQERADERNEKKPYRGTLLGIEVALLDLVSRALNLPLSEVLGQERDSVTITVSTLSTQNSAEQFRKKVEKQGRYPMVRVKGIGDFDKDSSLLELVHSANQAAGRSKPIWMDLNEGFDEPGAVGFLKYVAEAIRDGRLPEIISLEQPIPGRDGERLPELQRVADELTADSGIGEIRIMPDESLWDIDDLETVHSGGGCRAMNIKTAKAGGLLASLDLARRAVELNPETSLCIGGMVGTSDITTWSLLSLAKALPRVDYITAVPPGNVKQRISHPLARFESRESSVLANSDQPGIGAELDEAALSPFIFRQQWFPESADPEGDQTGAAKQISLIQEVSEIPSESKFYRVLFLGDFHYGESYSSGGGSVLPERGYQHGTEHLSRFIDRADVTIANLETPVVDPTVVDSPFEGQKRFLHWSDQENAPQALRDLGVDAVSLANNHTLDYGREGLRKTLQAMAKAGVEVFGAGEDLVSAREPLRLPIPKSRGGGSLVVHGSMLVPQKPTSSYDPFATEDEPGCAPLGRKGASSPGNDQGIRNLHIAFPHWGPNYKWRTPRQELIAKRLVRAGFDVVLGHGAHCVQEIGQYNGRWVAFGIGNSHFQAKGRFDSFVAQNGILPFSFWTMLTLEVKPAGERQVFLRLYPVRSDNRITDFQPDPVGEDEFHRLLQDIYERSKNKNNFDENQIAVGRDELGHFIQLNIGVWEKQKDGISRSFIKRDKADGGTSGTVERSAVVSKGVESSKELEVQRLLHKVKSGRLLGTQLIVDRASADGASVQWLGRATCVVSWNNDRILLQGNRSTESTVAAGIIKDKYLTKKFLNEGGSRALQGAPVHSPQEAVELQNSLGCPVVVKPRSGDRGRGVTADIKGPEEISVAFEHANDDGSGVIVEEFVPGEEFRCIATPDECLSVVRRIYPNVEGDGRSTIEELIGKKNAVRKQNPNLFKRPILIDDLTRGYLAKQGLSLTSVPSKGERITVRNIGNVSGGADTHECLEEASEDLKQVARSAVASIPGLKWAGVDIIVSSITGQAYVLEINVNSGIGPHHFPMWGSPKDVAGRIWRDRSSTIFRKSENSKEIVVRSEIAPLPPGRLSSAIADVLGSRDDLRVEYLTNSIYSVTEEGGRVEWVRGCSTTQDLSVTLSVLRQKKTLHKLLSEEGIPVDIASSSARIELTGREQGRLRVVATRDSGLLVIAAGDGPELPSEHIHDAIEVAIRAIRAVPELRWGIAEVALVNYVGAPRGLTFVVCDLTRNVSIAEGDVSVWGSLHSVAETIL